MLGQWLPGQWPTFSQMPLGSSRNGERSCTGLFSKCSTPSVEVQVGPATPTRFMVSPNSASRANLTARISILDSLCKSGYFRSTSPMLFSPYLETDSTLDLQRELVLEHTVVIDVVMH